MLSKVLVLAPHTDDGELGCGGTIAKFVEEGKEVICVAFSIAEDSLLPGFPKDTLKFEFREAMLSLGLEEKNIISMGYRVRHFSSNRQEILEDIVKLRNQFNPDLVLIPSINDIHQDHKVIAEEGLRAFKKTSILGYELPWNNIVFETRSFVKLEEKHVIKKITALKSYKTQSHRSYLNENFIRGLAVTRGTQFECDYAEAFEVVRYIL